MANVISELFKDIADSIRYKTGETVTMKPAEFPAEIMSIVTGGGSSGGESGGESGGGIVVSDKWIGESGLFTAEDNTYTIEHHLGKKPDIFLVKLNVANSALEGTAAATLVSMFITSDNLLGDATNIGSERLYYGTGFMYNPSKHIILSSTYSSGYESLKYPPIFATDTTIKFDTSGAFILSPNYSYAWGAYARTTTSSGGGGSSGESSDLVKHVTFIGEDGTQLYRMPVLTGDNCKDPVANGNIATPTKESTVNTVYTFSGWSLTQGGSANSAALSNVTEDRTVYVAFKSSVRKYTVRFYDGDTLIKTQQVAYGGSSSYTYSKDNYVFTGWNPEPVNVTSDMSCYAQLEEVTDLNDMTWDRIADICERGLAKSFFNLGDTKTIHITHPTDSSKSFDMDIQIVGFDADPLASGDGKAKITFASVPVISYESDGGDYTLFGYSDIEMANYRPWSKSTLRTFLNETFFNSFLSSDMSQYIKSVTKYTQEYYSVTRESYEAITTDKIFIINYSNELCGEVGYTKSEMYPYFDSAEKRAKKDYLTKKTTLYITRENSFVGYISINIDGTLFSTSASATGSPFVLCFCI